GVTPLSAEIRGARRLAVIIMNYCTQLKRLQKSNQIRLLFPGKTSKAPARARALHLMATNGLIECGGAAIMQQGPSKTQSPQGGRAELLTLRRRLFDAVPSPNVVEQQVGEEAHRLPVEQRVSVRPGHQLWNVTGDASSFLKQPLAA